MKQSKRFWTAVFASAGMLTLIFDSRSALTGASYGVELCLRSVIPSLFPFILLSISLTDALTGKKVRLLRPLGRLCGIPEGAEGLLAIGLLGGYPVGAQSVYQAYKANRLSKTDAHRMLGFCSNAGPAFIFGMIGPLFSSSAAMWLLWGIHILSALLTGILLPRNENSPQARDAVGEMITFPEAIKKTVQVMANICCWVIVFRVILQFCEKWFLWLLPQTVQTSVVGFLELVNGCHALQPLKANGLKYILCAGFLGFGGICVVIQTVSVTGDLGTGLYIPGKIMQCAVSIILAAFAQMLLFKENAGTVGVHILYAATVVLLTEFAFIRLKSKKAVAFRKILVYNK